MSMFKRVLAAVCTLAVTATMSSPLAAVSGYADEQAVQRENAIAPLADTELPMEGKCGDNVTWQLDSAGTLTIRGTGKMYDFYSHTFTAPWDKSKDNIKLIAIEEGITSIGSSAFENCINLTSVIIPDSVTQIGQFAFRNCTELKEIIVPNGVSEIKPGTFASCTNLENIILPNSIKRTKSNYLFTVLSSGPIYLDTGAFENCNLKSIYLPESIEYISKYTFLNCTSLKDVYYSGTEEEWTKISIDSGNEILTNATIHYNYKDGIGEAAGEKVYFKGHTYQAFKFDNVTGRDVISYCKKMGGYMAHINDAEENAFLSNYIWESNIGYAYFGYTDEDVEGDWKWVDGKNSSYTNWGKNEPNNEHGEEHYAIINQDGSWNDGGFEGDSAKGRAFVICEWEGEEPLEQAIGNVHFLSSYNPETGKVRFDESSTHIGLDYTLSDTIDKEFVASLVDKYVVLEIDSDSLTVTDLKPVESKIGTISAIDKTASTITIDGAVYPISEDNSVLTLFADQQIGKTVLFHTYEGTVVALSSIEKKTGTLESWDFTMQELTIDGKVYPTNSLTDISFLANIDELFGRKVTYTYVNSIYSPIVSIELYQNILTTNHIVSVDLSELQNPNLQRDLKIKILFDSEIDFDKSVENADGIKLWLKDKSSDVVIKTLDNWAYDDAEPCLLSININNSNAFTWYTQKKAIPFDSELYITIDKGAIEFRNPSLNFEGINQQYEELSVQTPYGLTSDIDFLPFFNANYIDKNGKPVNFAGFDKKAKYNVNKPISDILNKQGGLLLKYKMYFAPWDGSCHGMSSVVALANIGQLDVAAWDSNAQNCAELTYPYKSMDSFGTNDLIKYYDLLQYVDSYPYQETNVADLTWDNVYEELVKQLRNIQVTKTPVIVSFVFNLDGSKAAHTCVAYSMNQINNGYEIVLYDPSSPQNAVLTIQGKKVTYSSSFGEDLAVYSIGLTNIKDLNQYNIDSQASATNRSARVQAQLLSTVNERTSIYCSAVNDFSLTNSNGETLIYKNGELSGDMTVYSMRLMGEGQSAEYMFEVDSDTEFTYTADEDQGFFAVSQENSYLQGFTQKTGSVISIEPEKKIRESLKTPLQNQKKVVK